jgi:hypothetical protein
MSLVISITCAILATLLQQWARRYLKVTQTRFSLHKRARIRTFFAEGVEKSFLPRVVQALPTLIHVSLVLFFAGLAVFLWNVNFTIFKLVLSWIGVCTSFYGCTMLISIVRRDSPYYTPLTPLALSVMGVMGLVPCVVAICYGFLVFCWTDCFGGNQLERFVKLIKAISDLLSKTFMAPEKVALTSPPDLDARALMWTFSRLDEDHELERFFSGFPGFTTSKVVKDPLHDLDDKQKWEILAGMIGFLDRTFSSNLLPDQVKRRRVDICEKAFDLLDTYDTVLRILRGLACANWCFEPVMGPAQSTKIVQFVRRWGNRKGGDTTPVSQSIFSIAVARVKQHDDSWFILASDALGVPETVLRSHAAHHNNLSLVILIHIIRQQFIYIWAWNWEKMPISDALESASRFDVLNTSPELRHEFCALWNQIVRKAQNDADRDIPWWILHSIRGIYISLHQGTDSAPTGFCTTYDFDGLALEDPSAYPLCIDPSHFLDESAPTTFPRTVQHYYNALFPASISISEAPSSPTPASPHPDENPVVPTLDISHPTNHTVDNLTISLISPAPANASAIRDVIALGIPPHPTPGASTSSRPRSSTSPTAALSLLHDEEDLLTPSDSPNLPLESSGPTYDNIIPTGPSLSCSPILDLKNHHLFQNPIARS